MQRERELLQYERELVSREKTLLKSTLVGESTPQQRIPSLAEINALIPAFNPDDKMIDAALFLRKIEEIANIYGYNEHVKLHCAILRLERAAKIWFSSEQSTTTSWVTFHRNLLLAFPLQQDTRSVHLAMDKRRKLASESINHYFYEMVAKGKQGNFSEDVIIEYIINGIDNDSAARTIAVNKPTTLAALLKQLTNLDNLESSYSDRTYKDNSDHSSRKYSAKVNVSWHKGIF